VLLFCKSSGYDPKILGGTIKKIWIALIILAFIIPFAYASEFSDMMDDAVREQQEQHREWEQENRLDEMEREQDRRTEQMEQEQREREYDQMNQERRMEQRNDPYDPYLPINR
jgi:hypothetical protein